MYKNHETAVCEQACVCRLLFPCLLKPHRSRIYSNKKQRIAKSWSSLLETPSASEQTSKNV